MLAVGVSVAVQVMPPSEELKPLKLPFGDGEIRRGQASHGFAEGDGHGGGFTRRERRISDHDSAAAWAQGINRIVSRIGYADTGIGSRVGITGVIDTNDVASVFDIDRWCEAWPSR